MTEVEIRSPRYDETAETVVWDVRARVRAEHDALTFDGEPQFARLEAMPILDPASGRQLTAADDPVAWARLLPTALRSGDLVAVVVCCDGPSEEAPGREASERTAAPRIPAARPASRSRVG